MAIQTVKLTLNGVTHTGVLQDGLYAFDLTAPEITSFNKPGGYYNIEIEATTTDGLIATADSAHPIVGKDLRLVVVERIRPTITATYPADGAYVGENTVTVTFSLREEPQGSGVNLNTLAVTFDGERVYDIIADPAPDGYDCSFTITNLPMGVHVVIIDVEDNDGNAADTEIRAFTHGLIFDRTQADIDLALALRRQNAPLPRQNLKIAWDWRALNRIENFCAYLVDILHDLGYDVTITTKTDWNQSTVGDLVSQGQRVLSNIQKLVDTFYVLPTTPDLPPHTRNLTYGQANDIERVLHDLAYIALNIRVHAYSGELYAGEDDWA